MSTTKSSSKENFSFPPCFGSKSCWDILSVAPDRREGNQFVTDEIPENTSVAQTARRNFRKALQCDGGEKPNVSVRSFHRDEDSQTLRPLVGSPPPPADVETLCVGDRVLPFHRFVGRECE